MNQPGDRPKAPPPFNPTGRQSAWLQAVQHATGIDPRPVRPTGLPTNMAAGIAAGAQTLRGRQVTCALMLATDGYSDDAEAAVRATGQAKSQGLRIITIATLEANRTLLARMAQPRLHHVQRIGSAAGGCLKLNKSGPTT